MSKGWQYDDTIKGYNRDGTQKKKKKVKENVVEKSKLNLNPTPGSLDPKYLNNEELTLEDFKRITNPEKRFDYSNNKFDYSPNKKKSPTNLSFLPNAALIVVVISLLRVI